MKKIYSLTIALATLALSSCNMDLAPIGSIDDEVAIQTVSDAVNMRNGFYSGIRAVTSSQFMSYADIQADMFNGLTVNGNRMGAIANGNLFSSNDDVYGYWSSLFYYVNNCNFFLDKATDVLNKYQAANDEVNVDKMNLYIAEAHFFRGYYYAIMFDRWCVAYTSAQGDTPGMGLPIVTRYYPTADRDDYPTRATMNETIKFMNDEIQLGLDGIKAWEDKYSGNADYDDKRLAPNAIYISSYACKALQARIALWMNDYARAMQLANEVINCGIYRLTALGDYVNMWKNDTGTEIIFEPYETTQELGNAIGASWLNNEIGADYIPTSTMVEALMKGGVDRNPITGTIRGYNDVRYNAFITERNIKSPYGNVAAPCFNKFPGNPTLQTGGDNNYVNRPKPFRLSEMYFIVAEAAYETGDQATALKMLNTYMANRVKGYEEADLNGTALRDEIRLQKGLEFVGEGYRLSDLRRWKMGFNRATGANYGALDYTGLGNILTPAGLNVVYETNDHRYTWPIPSTEIQCNPQMAGQQNPGY